MSNGEMLTLPYLGQREYLHGTTLYDALRDRLRGGENIRFKLARMIRSDRVRVEQPGLAPGDPSVCAATLTWSASGDERRLDIVPAEPSRSPRREPFDEEAIVSRARFERRCAMLNDQRQESFVRSAVALNKALLFRLLTPPLPGQWLFTRLELGRDIDRFAEMAVCYRGQVGFSAVSSAVEVDGHAAGTVMFSWLKK